MGAGIGVRLGGGGIIELGAGQIGAIRVCSYLVFRTARVNQAGSKVGYSV